MATASERMEGRQVSSMVWGPRFQAPDVTTAMATMTPKKIWASTAWRMPESSGSACVMALAPRSPSQDAGGQADPTELGGKSDGESQHQNHGHAPGHVVPELEQRGGGRDLHGGCGGDGALQTGDDGAQDDGDQREDS